MPEALYRKYRPQVFADVVGQEPIQRTLKNALEQQKVSHAYLFTGPRGTGKTTTARLLAKALLCQKGYTAEPDGTCEDCQLIAEGAHPDVYELDAASRTGVENVREEIISRVQYAPTRGRSKVYIIDEVHMLSTAAFNALLKTLEEPPAHVVFILCTTDPQKVPETIHSRCQRFDFHRIAPEAMVTRLGAICVAEGVEFEGEALDLVAQRAEGGLRNALTSLEQIIAFEDGKITLAGAERLLGSIDSNDMTEIMALVGTRDIAGCFQWVSDYVETGADLAQFARDMSQHVRDLYVMALAGDDAVLDVPETTRAALASELQWFGPERASRLLGVLGDVSAELKTSSNQRLTFEIALTRMVRPDSDLTLAALAERVEALEGGYSAVAHVLPTAQAPAAVPEAAAPAAVPAAAAESLAAVSEPTPEPAPAAPAAEPAPQPEAAPSAVAEPQPAAVPAEPQPVVAQPQEAAPAADSKAASLANPAALQRLWQAVFGEVKKVKQAHAVLFMNTKVTFDETSQGLRIEFPAEASFAYENVQKPEVQQTLEQAILKTFGQAVPFAVVKAGSGQAAAPAPAAEPAPEPAPQAAVVAAAPVEPQGAPVAAVPMEAAPVTGQPSAAAMASEPAAADDFYDEPPLSVYEDCAPAAEPVAEEPYRASAPAEAPTARDAEPEPVPAAEASPVPAEDPAAVEAMIRNGFGEGIVFEEVDE